MERVDVVIETLIVECMHIMVKSVLCSLHHVVSVSLTLYAEIDYVCL